MVALAAVILPRRVTWIWHSLAAAPAESDASRPVARFAALHAAVKRSAEAVQVVLPTGRQVLVSRSDRAMPLVAIGANRSGSTRSVLVVPAHSPATPVGHGVSVSVHVARPPGRSWPCASVPTNVGPLICTRAPSAEVMPTLTLLPALNCAATRSSGSEARRPVGMTAASPPSTAASAMRSASGLRLASPCVRRHPAPCSMTRCRSNWPSLGRSTNTTSPTSPPRHTRAVITRSPF